MKTSARKPQQKTFSKSEPATVSEATESAWTTWFLRGVIALLVAFMVSSVWVATANATEDAAEVTTEVSVEDTAPEDEAEEKDGLRERLARSVSYILKGDSSEIVSEADMNLQSQREALAEREAELSAARDEMLSKSHAHEKELTALAEERAALREMRNAIESCVLGALPNGGEHEDSTSSD